MNPFEGHLSGVPHARVGYVTDGARLLIRGRDGGAAIDAPLADLKAAWQSTFAGF